MQRYKKLTFLSRQKTSSIHCPISFVNISLSNSQSLFCYKYHKPNYIIYKVKKYIIITIIGI